VRRRWKEYVEELYDNAGRPQYEELGIEEEQDVEEDRKGPQILEEEVIEAIKCMKDGKAEGIDGIPAELWKRLDEEGTRYIVQLCQQIYREGVWPEDFRKTIMIPIPKKANATDCSDFRTISLIPHVTKILLRIITKRIEGRIEDYISRTQFGFRKGVGTRDAIGVMRMVIERSLENGNEVYVCFVDFEKAFDRVKWAKLMEVIKKVGVDWRDRRMLAELYTKQEVLVRVNGELTEPGKIGRGVRQGCLVSPLLFSIYAETMMAECLEGMDGGVRVGGDMVQDVRFADDQAMVDNTEEGLQCTMNSLQQTAARYGMKVNVKKTKVMKISRKGGGTVNVSVEGTRLEQVEKYRYLGSWITDDGRCDKEIKARIVMAKEAFSRRKELMTRSLSRKIKKRIIKSLVWTIVLYGAETWTMRKEDVKRLEAFEMWVWRRMEKIPWTDKITNKEVLERIGEERHLVSTVVMRKKKWIGHVIRGQSLMKFVMEGRMEGKRPRGRKRMGMLEELLEGQTYEVLRRRAVDRTEWRKWIPRTCLRAEHL